MLPETKASGNLEKNRPFCFGCAIEVIRFFQLIDPPMKSLTLHIFRLLSLILLQGVLILGVVACSGDDEDKNKYVERPVEELYNQGANAMAAGEYKEAVKTFNEVERQHPYSPWATRGQLMAAYAHYLNLDYDETIISLDHFIQLNPGYKDIDYAYYLRAISLYEQISDVKRDQQVTEEAMASMRDVIVRFPDTEFARDAQLKYDLTRDHLAGKEMEIGRYYLRRHQYTAAINRFRTVVESFQTTSHVPEALLRLAECYTALGITDEARAATAVLGHNFPGSDWYEDAYVLIGDPNYVPSRPEGDGWFTRMWDRLENSL
jgi:outer membrane protein assembly factor BamD